MNQAEYYAHLLESGKQIVTGELLEQINDISAKFIRLDTSVYRTKESFDEMCVAIALFNEFSPLIEQKPSKEVVEVLPDTLFGIPVVVPDDFENLKSDNLVLRLFDDLGK